MILRQEDTGYQSELDPMGKLCVSNVRVFPPKRVFPSFRFWIAGALMVLVFARLIGAFQ